MTATEHHPHSVPALALDLRRAAIIRRVSASGPVAGVLASLAYGDRQRDHVEVLHHATRARVASCAEVR